MYSALLDGLDESSDALVIDEGVSQAGKKSSERRRENDRSSQASRTVGPSLGSVQIIENEPMELDSSEVSRGASSTDHNQAAQSGAY